MDEEAKEAIKPNKKAKKVIDPTKPLKEPKYEKMAMLRAQGMSKTQAYKEIYPKANYDSAKANGYELIKREQVDERALHLLASVGLSEGKLARSLNDCVDSSDERIKLDGTKFGLNMLGYGKTDQKLDNKSYSPTMINIIIRSKSNDDKEIHTIDTTVT